MAGSKPLPKNFAENLQLAGSVNERFTTLSRGGQPHAVSIPIRNAFSVQRKSWSDPGSKIEQIPHTDFRFVRVSTPFCDRIANRIIKIQDPILNRGSSRNAPKTLCAAKDGDDPIALVPIYIALIDDVAILHDHKRIAAMQGGISRCGLQRRSIYFSGGRLKNFTWHRHANQRS